MKTPIAALIGAAVVALLVLFPRPAEAGGVVGTGPGTCTEAALDARLAGGGHVTFNCGGDNVFVLTSPIIISHDTSIDGAGLIAFSGNSATDLFHIDASASLTLTRLTVAGGKADKDGGAIFNRGQLTIDRSVLLFNDASGHNGGAIYNEGLLTIVSSQLADNQSLTGTAGAIYSVGVMTITNSSFSLNRANIGGAIVNANAVLTISGSTFSENAAGLYAGAIETYGQLRLDDTSFDNNSAGMGGAIGSENNLSIRGGVFFSNTATSQTGGALASDGLTFITGTLFLSNTATTGGGALDIGHTASVVDSTIQGNQAPNGVGGGIFNEGHLFLSGDTIAGNTAGVSGVGNGINTNNLGTLTIVNSTISGNFGGSALRLPGGGGPSGGGLAAFGPVTITNSTLAGNDVGGLVNYAPISATVKNTLLANNNFDCLGPIQSLGHNLASDSSCHLNGPGDLPHSKSFLGPLADNGGPTQTQALRFDSPAINAGDNAGCPSTDQRGYRRWGACDIGAFEYSFRLLLPLARR